MAQFVPLIETAKEIGATLAKVTVAKDAMKAFTGAMGDLKSFGEEGARNVRGAFSEAQKLLGVIDPLILPLELLTSQITTGTADASLKLTSSVFALMDTEGFKTGVFAVTTMINTILQAVTGLTDFLTLMSDPEGTVRKAQNFALSVQDYARSIVKVITDEIRKIPVMINDWVRTDLMGGHQL